METEEVIFLSKGKDDEALVFSTDGKNIDCLSKILDEASDFNQAYINFLRKIPMKIDDNAGIVIFTFEEYEARLAIHRRQLEEKTKMDQMYFEEEIQDKEYFELKIQKLEERIIELENKALVYGKWPEHDPYLEKTARSYRNIIKLEKEVSPIIKDFIPEALDSGVWRSYKEFETKEDSDGE